MRDQSLIVYRSPPTTPSPLVDVLEYGTHRISTRVENRPLDVFAAVLVERGSGTLHTAAGQQNVNAPAIFFLWPGQPHAYGPTPTTIWEEQWALFDGKLAPDMLAAALISPKQPLLHLHDLAEMQRLFSLLRTEMGDDTPLARASSGARLHRIALEAARQSQMPRGYPPETSIAPAIEALRQQAFGEIDLIAFAADFGMSPATLRRKFIATAGMPPKAFQLRLRLDRAKEMLAITEASIEIIAREVGFEDAFYFSRLFSRREAISPSTFRQRNRRG